MFQNAQKKHYTIGDGLSMGKGGLEEQAYLRSYVYSECRPLEDLVPLWKEYRKFHHHHNFEKWLLERDKIRKSVYENGIALGHDFVPHVHKEMCDMFVAKNFDNVYHEGYTLGEVRAAINKQNREKEMLLLAPRGAFKSTTDCADACNWLINCPDIRISILCPEYKLAVKFLKMVKGYFNRPENTDPTYFQALFPEYMISEVVDEDDEDAEAQKKRGRKKKTKKDNSGQTKSPLFSPARVIPQAGAPSLWVNSIAGSLSGNHCDVLKGDDIVDDENSNSEVTRETISTKWNNALNLVDEWGFIDQIGTRYYTDDLWGQRIAIMDDKDHPVPMKFLKRACWTVKAGFEGFLLKELKEEMVELYFPEKLTFIACRYKLLRNERIFRCQQLNEPAMSDEELVHFDETAMRRAHMPGELAPEGTIYICWDTSAGSKGGDFSCGAVGKITERGELFNIENVYGKWKHSQLAQEVVKLGMKWPQAKCILIEDFVGSELFKREVNNIAMQHGVTLPIMYHQPPPGADAKRNRIKGLEILLTNGLLFFANGWWTDELMKQFTKYTGEKSSRRHDDIPDAIAYLQLFLPSPDYSTSEYAKLKKAAEEKALADGFAGHIFGAPSPPMVEVETEDYAPVSLNDRYFGGNGIKIFS